ncbi:hypothetical protein SAMD00019534_105610 [Acytostelium subglobosum LB1]|uniref:hypothetical protein n=1 Tax=Acytostelium subglobosum LB1 TaxID=1410327 RepID=UPI0006448D30|nr:hypothetical protein SAMD00019534_105610 [Acytostelium subglobosum LB1]GAM27386.1 hypothetical protein SAMD00019534_105610 [Acytostelium subglobosum LB1]|eukprot:XP_012749853.1 hypothetical protein SAMD00019534_105610 [Acytostelium subglobosum LB1]
MDNTGDAEAVDATQPFPFYSPDDDSNIIYIAGANRKDGAAAIKCCQLAKLVEKMTQTVTFDSFFGSAFFLTYKDFTTPMELVQLLISRYTGPTNNASKDHLRLFEIEVEIVQANVIHMIRQLIGTLNEKDFQETEFVNLTIEFINSLPEDLKNELFLMFFKIRRLAKPPQQRAQQQQQRPNTTIISSAASTMRFSFSVSPKTESPNSTSDVLTGLLSNTGSSPNSTQSSIISTSSAEGSTRGGGSSTKISKGRMSKISLMPPGNGSSSGATAHSPLNAHSSMALSHHLTQIQNNLDEDGFPVIQDKPSFPPEMIARELTIMEYELIAALGTHEFSQKAWTKEGQAANIRNFVTWFNRISSWVTTKIISKETPEERAVIIEAFINIAHCAKELKNYNCVMEIIASLHNSSISRLKNSWALVSPKSTELFTQLTQFMSSDNNFKVYRKSLLLVQPTEPCIPYMALFLTDYTYLDESNPATLHGMVNIERIFLIGTRVQEFFKLFTNCSYGFVSAAAVREAILSEKVWDENETFRLSKIREDHTAAQVTSPSSSALGLSTASSGSGSGSMINLKRGSRLVTRYRLSFTGNDPPPSISSTLSDRDWKILSTNASTVKHKRGKKILSTGEVNSNLYRIISGRIKFENSAPDETRHLDAGDIFGEECFLYDHPMLFNVVCDSDECELVEIEKTFILQLFVSEPILAATFYKHIAVLFTDRLRFELFSSSPILNALNGTSTTSNSSGDSSANSTPGNSSPSRPFAHSTSTLPMPGGTGSLSSTGLSPSMLSHSTSSIVDKRKSLAIPSAPSSMELQMMGTDTKFRSTFGLPPEEIIIKSYPAKHNSTTGTLYITKHHLCFEGKKFGRHKQKVIPFDKISKILPEKGSLSMTLGDKTKRFSLKSAEDLSEAYGIMTKIWKNHFGSSVRSPTKLVPPPPPRSPKIGRTDSFTGIADLPTKDEWAQILKGTKTMKYRKGEVLVIEGTEFQKIFQITSGECTIVKGLKQTDVNATMNPPTLINSSSSSSMPSHMTVLARLTTGSIFGEMSFLMEGGSSISVIVSSDTLEVYTLEGYFLNIMLKSKPLLAPKFYKYLACVLESRLKLYRQTSTA